MIQITYSSNYYKTRTKLLTALPFLGEHVNSRIEYFRKNPEDTRLFNHALHKGLDGKWAFSITDDIRIVYEWTSNNTVRFLSIGGHTAVYH
jgi:mRNA-degrading endonuclease YafQ of YafQ-DinJ toxin-antitoxin module